MIIARYIARKHFMIFLLIVNISFVLDSQRSVYSSGVQSELNLLKDAIVSLTDLNDTDAIIKIIAHKPYVMIGDSTHGSYEFYQLRFNLSKKLIQEMNFKLIVLEGDLPNIYRINQYVQSQTPATAMQVLNVSNPQGAWLWDNVAMLNFIQWLKKYNAQLPEGEQKVSLHGIDIYSFDRSRREVIDYLKLFSPQAAQQANFRYQCFNRFDNDLHRYGKIVNHRPLLSCESEVMEQYLDFHECRYPCPEQYSFIDRDKFFYAQQNARVVKNTEKSFRIQYQTGRDADSWNQRDRHMMESFRAVSEYLNDPKTIFWAHNSHIGDASATEMVESYQLNLGQLMRQYVKQQVFTLGLLTYRGMVTAADDWQSPTKIKALRDAHPASNEALFHSLGKPFFMLYLHHSPELVQLMNQTRLQRHVGVVYRPFDELDSHYTYTHLAAQFDAIIYIDVTTPVISLKHKSGEFYD